MWKMLKDVSKKLTMKKTFFTTQLEGFFNSITQEYHDIIHELEVEKRVLQEQIAKQDKDLNNLIEIKNKLQKQHEIDTRRIRELQESLAGSRDLHSNAYLETILKENETLKERLAKKEQHPAQHAEITELQNKIQKLQGFISKGANAYSENIMNEQKENIIKEISESLKKE